MKAASWLTAAVLTCAVLKTNAAGAACDQAINWAVPGTLADWESTNDYCKWQVIDPTGDETNGVSGDDILGFAYTHSEATAYTDIYFLMQLAAPPVDGTTYEMLHDGTDGAVSTFDTTCTDTYTYTCTAKGAGQCSRACRTTCAADCATTTCTVTQAFSGATCDTSLTVKGSTDGKCAGTNGTLDDAYTTTYATGTVGTATYYYLLLGGVNMAASCYPYYQNTAYTLNVIAGGTTVDTASTAGTYPDAYTGSTAVALLAFTARDAPVGADLSWDTGSEHGTVGFIVHRDSPEGPAVNIAPIPGLLESPAGRHYALHDPEGHVGSVYYLEELSVEGRHRYGPSRWETGLEAVRYHGLELHPALSASTVEEAPRIGLHRTTQPPQDAFIRVSSEGIYTVSASQLTALGLTDAVRLTHDGAAWPLFLLPDGQLAFYAPAPTSPERATDAYELTPSTAALPSPIAAGRATSGFATGFTSTVHAEQHTTIDLPAEPDHRFPWNYAFSGTPTTFSFDAPGLQAGPASVSVRLIGLDAFDHDAQIQVNGVTVPDTVFAGTGETVASFSLPSGALVATGNVLTLNAVAAADAGYDLVGLVSIDTTYPRAYQASASALTFTAGSGAAIQVKGFSADPLVFDVTTSSEPRMLSGVATGRLLGSTSTSLELRAPNSRLAPTTRTYYAAAPQPATLVASLASEVPSGSADYVAIVGSGLDSTLQPLLQLRQSQGLTVLSVDVEALYDKFNSGEHGPEAIQAYLAQLSPQPVDVLLVGKPSIDPSNYLGTGTPDLVPAPYILTADYSDLAIFDGSYVAGADGLTPTIAIGRLPAQTAAELAPLVAKLVAYEQGNLGPSGSAVWAADDDDPDTGQPDPFFVTESNSLANQFPQLQALDVFLPNQTTTDLLAALAQGPDLVSYHGHGDGLDWSTSGLLTAADVPSLPAARPFFLITVDCWDGMYAMPTFAPLSQLIVETAQGGAVASYSASSLVEESRDPGIDLAIYTAVGNSSLMTVGQVSLAAQQALAAQPAPANDLARVYNLIGDPATTLPLR